VTLSRSRVSVGSVFLLHAVTFGSWAPRIPAIEHRLHLSHGRLGVALLGLAFGALGGTQLAAVPVNRFGSRVTTRVALLAMCAALIGPALAPDLASLTATLLVWGFAAGLTDVAMNTQAVALERAYRRPLMSGLHGLWSLGLFVGALGAGAAAGVGLSPIAHFTIAAVVLGLVSLPLCRFLLHDRHEQTDGGATALGRPPLWCPPLLLLAAIGFCSVFGEGAAADWSAVYLKNNLGTGAGFAAAAFAAFSLAMAGSRLCADRLIVRFGPVAVVRAAALIAAGGLALAVAPAQELAAVAGFGLAGVGLAPIVPVVVSAAGNLGLGRSATVVGRVMSLSYTGSMIGPAVIGFSADRVGLRAALGIPAALALVVVPVARRVSSAHGRAEPALPHMELD
jgi:MFS family permease